MAVLVATLSAQAGDYYGGSIVDRPSVVKVRTEQGEIKEYQISKELYYGTFSENYLSVSDGLTSKCPPFLGQLAEEFVMTIRLSEDRSLKTVRVAPSAEGREISVFGECGGKTNVLKELMIRAQEGAKFEIQ